MSTNPHVITTASVLNAEQMQPILHGAIDYALYAARTASTYTDYAHAVVARQLIDKLSQGCMIYDNFLNAPSDLSTTEQQLVYVAVLAGIQRCRRAGDDEQVAALTAIQYLLQDGMTVTL